MVSRERKWELNKKKQQQKGRNQRKWVYVIENGLMMKKMD